MARTEESVDEWRGNHSLDDIIEFTVGIVLHLAAAAWRGRIDIVDELNLIISILYLSMEFL